MRVSRTCYRVIPDEDAESHGYVRVVDESGDDYGYAADRFLRLELPQPLERTVDLSKSVGKGVFVAWQDPLFFQQVRIGSSGELVWGEQIDLCPDALYLRVTGKKPEDIFPALRDRPIHA